jgi:hypothetical protein
MKTATWRQKHFADGDKALETAGRLLEGATAMLLADADIDITQRTILADGFINLARAHYRAVEVDRVIS